MTSPVTPDVRLVRDGVWQLDPLPPPALFRAEVYADIASRRDDDAEWWAQEYTDRLDLLRQWAVGRTLLDVGCGLGQFVAHARALGWDAMGVDPHCPEESEHIHRQTIYECEGTWDAITLYKVLEHLHDPQEMLASCVERLAPGGVMQVTTPNDYNDWQLATGKRQWWVHPDHLSYFRPDALAWGMAHAGLNIVHRTADFPMEWFLLLGWDYVDGKDARKVGRLCHHWRKTFEHNLGTSLRRKFYEGLARMGLGRVTQITGRKP